MYRVGIIGDRPEYVSDQDSLIRKIDRTIDLISYQYGEDLIINVGGNIGVDQWTSKICLERDVRYHLFLPCPADLFSENWYDDQVKLLEHCVSHSWAITIHSQRRDELSERKIYERLIDMSDVAICFWNGMKQGPVFEAILYALKENKITLNGSDELKLVTNADTGKK